MKKHQKILIGLMALGLVGGVGATLALTRTDASGSYDGQGTDSAIYLNWGSTEQQTAVTAEVKDLNANVAAYRYVVVAPKASTSVKGTVSVVFTLDVEYSDENKTTASTVLTGLTVGVYGAELKTTKDGDNEIKSIEKSGDVLATLSMAGTKTYTASFDVDGSTTIETKYYALEFIFDGSSIGDNTFGGSLAVSQSFTESASN